jgi:hypothetical protein
MDICWINYSVATKAITIIDIWPSAKDDDVTYNYESNVAVLC